MLSRLRRVASKFYGLLLVSTLLSFCGGPCGEGQGVGFVFCWFSVLLGSRQSRDHFCIEKVAFELSPLSAYCYLTTSSMLSDTFPLPVFLLPSFPIPFEIWGVQVPPICSALQPEEQG